MNENEFSRSSGMTPHRIESLADGIFAFAMTLLVLSINLPPAGPKVNVGAYLLGQYQNFWNFALSFLLLAFHWGHSSKNGLIDPAGEEKHIARVNRKAFFYPGWSTLVYLLVPLAIFSPERIRPLFLNKIN